MNPKAWEHITTMVAILVAGIVIVAVASLCYSCNKQIEEQNKTIDRERSYRTCVEHHSPAECNR